MGIRLAGFGCPHRVLGYPNSYTGQVLDVIFLRFRVRIPEFSDLVTIAGLHIMISSVHEMQKYEYYFICQKKIMWGHEREEQDNNQINIC